MDGLLVVDKPAGPTSHDIVARVRRLLGERRVGHTGTLDPAATGVLPLAIGRATRLARFLSGADKEYDAVVRLGVRTTTGDAEGHAVGAAWTGPMPSRADVERALEPFRGTYEQRPPAFSAKKIGGVRSYKLARAHRAPGIPHPALITRHLAPVPVTVHRLDLLAVEADRVTVRLVCSAGFYVRSLADEIGERLGTGAHLERLRRVRSGEYDLAAAITLAAAEEDPGLARRAVIPLDRLLATWPAVVLTDAAVGRVAHGRDVGPEDTEAGALAAGAERVRLVDRVGKLVAVADRISPQVLHPAVVFV